MSMSYIPMVRAGAIYPFIGFLNDIGAPVDRLRKLARLNGHTMEDPEGLVPLLSTIAFLNSAARSQGLPILGLEVGMRTKLEDLGIFGALVRQSPTLGAAIDTGQRLLRSFDSGASIWLERRQSRAWVCHRSLVPQSVGTSQTSQYALMLFLSLIRLVAGDNWKPAEARLQMPHDKEIERFEAFSHACLLFDQSESALCFPAEFLSCRLRPLPQGKSAATVDYLRRLESSAPATDLAGSMKQLLLSQLGGGCTGILRMAELSGMSVRTLQRHLDIEGVRFSDLIDRIRQEQAARLLRETQLPSNEIARRLGYKDSANFTRAFRRWTGHTPSEFRRDPQG